MSRCDNASVGAVITDPTGRLLMVTRGRGPSGIAPPAGHVVDEHAGYRDAAVAEVFEETGLTATTLTDTGVGGWRPNRCGRDLPGTLGWGHTWRVYRTDVSGTLRPAPRETLGAAWYTPSEVQALAERTAAYARGEVPADEWATSPGVEPVWVQWLTDLGLVTVSRADLAQIDQCTRPAPTRTWTLDFASEDGHQVLYTDLTATERIGLAGLIAETTDQSAVSLHASTTLDGPRTPVLLRTVRIVSLRPYDDELGGAR